jgi:enoyl-CoA hydratase/carnithine racemase
MSKISVERQGPVARITLKNPPLNTLDVPLMTELAQIFRGFTAAAPADKPRAILLASGVPGHFSSGLDPAAVGGADVHGRKQVMKTLGAMVEAMWFCHIPVVADVNGPAIAGGAVLAALSDFAIIDASAGKICFSEVKVGLPVPYFIQRLVMSKVNPAAWSEIILLGKNLDAHEAHRLGLANSVYDNATEHEEALQSLLGRIGRLPPAVLSYTLREKRAHERQFMQEFSASFDGFGDFLTDDFLGKGLRAVIKGESPKF